MLPRPFLFQRIYNAPLQNRLKLATALHETLGHQLRRDVTFTDAFARLRQAAGTLAGRMAALGMGQSCAACAANNPGGCCSLEMAGEADALQMLMNMLAGVEVAIAADSGGACCFLGPEGCIFPFKPIFCLNYNCDRIIARIGHDRAELERLTGRLLGRQFEVEKLLLARVEGLAKLPAE